MFENRPRRNSEQILFTPIEYTLQDENCRIVEVSENAFHNRSVLVKDDKSGNTFFFPNVSRFVDLSQWERQEEMENENLPHIPNT